MPTCTSGPLFADEIQKTVHSGDTVHQVKRIRPGGLGPVDMLLNVECGMIQWGWCNRNVFHFDILDSQKISGHLVGSNGSNKDDWGYSLVARRQ